MHDDRADVCAMLCWHLAKLRAANVLNVERPKSDFSKLFNHGMGKQYNPFDVGKNPFLNNNKNPFND